MKTILTHLFITGFITAYIVLITDTVEAFDIEDRNIIYERSGMLRPTKKLRGRRKGFIFGFGAGVGTSTYTAPLVEYWGSAYEGSSPDPRSTTSAFTTEFKVGHGFTDQFLLYYTSRITWLPLSNLYRDTMIVNGVAGVGMMIYPLNSTDLYIISTAGLASLVTYQPSFKLERARQTGLAVSAGIGYELIRYLSVDFTVNYGNATSTQHENTNAITLSNEIVTFLVTANLIFY